MASAVICEQYESRVRSCRRDVSAAFGRASGHVLADENGLTYIDFHAGAGALNYGHDSPELKRAVVESAALPGRPRQSARSGAAERSPS
jgi:diaminobutyrate-2-oxoglutarate transaminase